MHQEVVVQEEFRRAANEGMEMPVPAAEHVYVHVYGNSKPMLIIVYVCLEVREQGDAVNGIVVVCHEGACKACVPESYAEGYLFRNAVCCANAHGEGKAEGNFRICVVDAGESW